MNQRLFMTAVSALVLAMTSLSVGANTIEGQLNGEPRDWHVLQESEASSVNFQEIMPGMISYTIQGHAEPQYAVPGTLSLNFMDMNGSLGEPEVSFFPNATLMPHYGESTTRAWELDVKDNADGSKQLTGHFIGTLIMVDHSSSNPDDSMEVEVRFEVQAMPE
ncbi:MAG: hypothetical protein ACOC00_05055 [Halothiobacillaceae bacterium]